MTTMVIEFFRNAPMFNTPSHFASRVDWSMHTRSRNTSPGGRHKSARMQLETAPTAKHQTEFRKSPSS